MRSFTIHLDLGVPANPIPADGASVGDATPDFDWPDVAGADGYQIQIDDSAAMDSPFVDDDALVDSDFLVTSLLTNGTYHWRVRIKSSGQWGDWSPVWSFTIVTAPEINLLQDTNPIPMGGSYGFGILLVSSGSSTVDFTIENQGTNALILKGTPRVAITGGDGSFVVDSQPGSPINPSSSTTFTVTFDPATPGLKTATVNIPNNDTPHDPFTFTLTGTGTAPEIDVKGDGTSIASGGSYGYGGVLVGSGGKAVGFTVDNTGDGNLNLTGSPRVSITGSTMFAMGPQPSSPILPGGSQPFTITFTPTGTGLQTATVTIANNDLNEGSYTFTLTGTGTAPEIDVKGDGTSIASGGSYGYGSVLVGSGGKAVGFTVDNTGDGDLNLTGSPRVSITGSTMFAMGPQPSSPILPGGSQPFTITFTPTGTGLQTATVTIANNDLNEGSYTFTLTGTGTAPEINVKGDGTDISDNTGVYTFANQLVGSSSAAIIFTIQNVGTASLNLTGSPRVSITGSTMFAMGPQPSSPILPGGSQPFTITFTPTSTGLQTATVTIANDDSNENPYNFTLTGTGIAPEINVKGDGTDISDNTGVYTFANQLVGSSSAAIIFTIQNVGTASLNLTGSPRVSIDRLDDVRHGSTAELADSSWGQPAVHHHLHPDEHGAEDGDGDDRQRRLQREPVQLHPDGHRYRSRDQRQGGRHRHLRQHGRLHIRQSAGGKLQCRDHLHDPERRHGFPEPHGYPEGRHHRH